MRIVSVRTTHIPEAENQTWTTGIFHAAFAALVEAKDGQAVRTEFVEKFLQEYDDVRYYTFQWISYVLPLEIKFSPTNTFQYVCIRKTIPRNP